VLVKLDLKPLGGLRVTGGPDGALVRVVGPDGYRAEGGLPWSDPGLRLGTYRIDVVKAGFESARRDVIVEPGQTVDVEIRLQAAQPPPAMGGAEAGRRGW
jgi:hypothetical protein